MNLEEKKKLIINFTYFIVWIVILYLLFKVAAVYLLPFLIGLIIAYIVQKPATVVSEKIKIKKDSCAAILSVLIFIFISILIVLFIKIIYNQSVSLISSFSVEIENIKILVEQLYKITNNFFKKIDFGVQGTLKSFSTDTISELLSNISLYISEIITNAIRNLPSLFISGTVTVVSTFYISKDYCKLLNFVKGFVSKSLYKKFVDIKNVFTECFFKFVIGYFWLFIITFSELMVGFFIIGIKHFIVLALFIALLDLLPVIGTGTVLLPWAILNIFRSEYFMGFGLIFLYLIITLFRNFIEPKVISKQIDINPIFTLIFIFLGFRLGGIFGMLFLPIILTVLFTYYRRQLPDS